MTDPSDAPSSRPAASSTRSSAGSRNGSTTLEDALALWERGEALHRRCAEILGAAEERLRALRPDSAES